MSTELVIVRNRGVGGALELDPHDVLAHTRHVLEDHRLMTERESFMVSGAPLERDAEEHVELGRVLVPPQTGHFPVLVVGRGRVPVGPKATNWTQMTPGEKLAVLNGYVQVTKGLSLSADEGLFKTTHDAIVPLTQVPSSDKPRINSSVTTNAYFSKYAESVATSSTNGGSLSADTPFGGGEASFEHAQSHSSSHSEVSTYFVGTYNVNKVVVELDKSNLQLTQDFYNALLAAAEIKDAPSAFVGIVEALNKYGWYVPIELTLGGVLFTKETTKVKTWSEASSQSNTFAASFKASFDGIGGGGAYKHSDKHKTHTGGAKGSDTLSFTAIGGKPADANNYPKWAASLEPASAWNVSSYATLISPIVLLMNMGTTGKRLAVYIKNNIANQYSSSPELEKLQPLIDCGNYSEQIGIEIARFAG